MIRAKGFVTSIFLYSIAVTPFVSLFREGEIGFLKVNWILYPLVLSSLIFAIIARNRVPRFLVPFLLIISFYFLKGLMSPMDTESIIRLFFSLAPFFFLDWILDNQDESKKRKMIIIYCLSIAFPIIYGILQYQGVLPFTNYDVVEGKIIGRITGGYDKPNNLAAFLFPLYLLSFIVFRKNRFIGASLLLFIIFLIFITGLRTTVVIYLVISLGYFFKENMARFVYNYYRYFFNLIAGFLLITGVYALHKIYGPMDLLRGRMLTWQGHVVDFFNSNSLTIFFGKGHSNLGDHYSASWYKGSLFEPHNNSLRVVVIFGLVGFTLYSILMRHFVLKAFKRTDLPLNKFFMSASFLFIMLYSFTNEPLFYPSVFWVALFGVFFTPSHQEHQKSSRDLT